MAAGPELFVPLTLDRTMTRNAKRIGLQVMARLKHGVTIGQAAFGDGGHRGEG